ncbi:MAG: SAM-dependent chlorinase/fluorinase [Anaerolineae bacterium]
MSRTVALLTDFGTTDTYVGVMKGVMLNICPDLQLVDLTHAVQPQNVKQAAFLLLNSYRYFPKGTTFLVVVDPGVGSSRKALAVRAGDYKPDEYTFVAPDNGVLTYILRELDEKQVAELDTQGRILGNRSKSHTFHGRDIFAPAAAYLAQGVQLERFSRPAEQYLMLPEPSFHVGEHQITGEVLHIDHFGTAVTSIGILHWETPDHLSMRERYRPKTTQRIDAQSTVIFNGDQWLSPVHKTYAEVAPGETLALVGSGGYLELSINRGSFAAQFGIKIGDPVELQIG